MLTRLTRGYSLYASGCYRVPWDVKSLMEGSIWLYKLHEKGTASGAYGALGGLRGFSGFRV